MSTLDDEATEQPRVEAPDGDTPRWPRSSIVEGIFALVPAIGTPLTLALLLSTTRLGEFDPVARAHQTGALAALSFSALVALSAIACAAALIGPARPHLNKALLVRLIPALLAGSASGIWAAGAVLALHGTGWSFNGEGGDVGRYIAWAIDGSLRPAAYPPGGIWLIRWYSILADVPPALAVKPVSIGVMSITGPAAYGAWRLATPPFFSLVAGVLLAYPLWDFYLPMRRLALFLFLPLLVALLRHLLVSNIQISRALPRSIYYGAMMGGILTLYSGWLYFSVLAIITAVGLLGRSMWQGRHTNLSRRLVVIAFSAAAFAIASGPYLLPILTTPGGNPAALVDDYQGSIDQALAAHPSQFIGDILGLPLVLSIALISALIVTSRRTTLDTLIVATLASAVIFRLVLLYRFGLTGNPGLFQRTGPVLSYVGAIAVARSTVVLAKIALERTSVASVLGELWIRRIGLVAAAGLIVVEVPTLVGAMMPAEAGSGRLALIAHSLANEE